MDPTDWPVLVLPGIGNSGRLHWQTLWEQGHPYWQRVNQREWDRPVREEWVAALDAAVAECVQPPVLVAHSIGCLVAVHWASRSFVPVRAAFLVAVPDPSGANFPAAAQGFIPLPLAPLRMPSLMVASIDDSFSPIAYARHCASAWGSQFVEIGPAGHINAESGHGAWPEGFRLLRQLLREGVSSSLNSQSDDEA
jgi:serine hydrolase